MPKTDQRYASIALPIPVDAPFTYSIPDELEVKAAFGHRALVPFGRRMITGFIIGVGGDPGDISLSKIKPISTIIDDEPVFDKHMLSLAGWVAEYYLSSVGEVLKAAMPFGTMIRSRLRIYAVDDPSVNIESLTAIQKATLDKIKSKSSVLMRSLEQTLGKSAPQAVRALEKKNLVRVEREITAPAARPQTVRHVVPVKDGPGQIASKAHEQLRCIDVLKRYPEGLPLSELLERHSFSRGVVNAVVRAGLAYYDEIEVSRTASILDQESVDADHPLTGEQKSCFRAIMDEIGNTTVKPFLVHGVTGSGKTRLYIEIVREMLTHGKGAIILVPEISLTPQTTRFFTSVFPGRVAVMHSAMSAGERYDMWRLIHDGKREVVIGPRSAVFAPLPTPGVIIVDEEHDSSYKQTDTSPRYHARDTAVVRARLLGIPVILGSATPSLESWQNARSGKYSLCTLTKRVHLRPLPDIVTVDMRAELAAGNMSSLSILLRDELAARIGKGEKSIILINRRGFATGIQCKSCGEAIMCPNCDVPLTFHSSKGLALCHLCGHEQLVLEHCPNCGSNDIRYRGAGTQRIEKELASIVKQEAIIRMDSDTTRAHDAHHRLLEEFRASDASILLGTQMVAKGLDFPEVTLVGIISADSSLYLPDFRAGERTFQLITQVAGRAGRGETAGTVVLQTFSPDNYAIEAAVKQDYIGFAEHELGIRDEVSFPPFTRIALIEITSDSNRAALDSAQSIASYMEKYAPDESEILGPAEASIPRLRGRYRMHILIKSPRITRILPLVRFTADKFQAGSVNITVDIDPTDLM